MVLLKNWALKNGWKPGLTLDRINGAKGYFPLNCRWTTPAIQAQNTKKSSRNTSGYRGVSWNKNRNKFGVSICVQRKRIWLGAFKTALEGAKIYDQYVIDHNLEHTLNRVL